MDTDNRPGNESGNGSARVTVAIAGALVMFCVVAIATYYRMADVPVHGWIHGGPAMLTSAMAGLFGGGFASLIVLVLLLQRR
jgi:hypothetical protein